MPAITEDPASIVFSDPLRNYMGAEEHKHVELEAGKKKGANLEGQTNTKLRVCKVKIQLA